MRLLHSILFARKSKLVASADISGNILRARIMERERLRRRRRDPSRDEFFVQVPESSSWLDTATMPMILTAVAVALFAKVLMMVCLLAQYDETKAQERLERKIAKAPPEQGTVRMLSREEWDEIQEIRPRTPFESGLARPHARIRTGEPIHLVSFFSIKEQLVMLIRLKCHCPNDMDLTKLYNFHFSHVCVA
ncbi:hypothetical protein KSP40_PGU003174 [Platanthera guangdongensis]|uniref:Uncharacterized protein n=1 Tax=Platanthera guangdongensis TaxID=2320717 RepID=A0ABR2M1E4_9ASPA